MLNCWESDKIRRPTFADIVDNIDKFLRSPEDLNDGLSAVTEKYVTLQSLLRSSVFWESALFVVRATQLFSVAVRTSDMFSSLLCILFQEGSLTGVNRKTELQPSPPPLQKKIIIWGEVNS